MHIQDNISGKKQRRSINYSPRITFFRPDGIGIKSEDQIVLEKDEIEAIRLIDFKKESKKNQKRIPKACRKKHGNQSAHPFKNQSYCKYCKRYLA